jgi:hypothetical protein
MKGKGLYLGIEPDGARMLLDPEHLTTHAVCLGMTGSGKTGLGIIALEELAQQKVPLLVIDLKGDMVNLLLTFPELAPESFAAWLPASAATSGERMEVAAGTAARWREGIEGSGLGSEQLRAVKQGLSWRLLTPGVASAAPLDILPALSAPAGWSPDQDLDGATARVNGLVSALLSLVGRGGDPLTDRDHVLLASIILEHWRAGDQLDLPGLLRSIAEPPISSFGALPLETFYPRKERMELLTLLNTLLASPAFVAWTKGTPLTMEELLGTPQQPRGTIVSIAHLDERQRLFILGLIFSELVSWMRRQPASAGLRALLYTDEVQGILPPHPANPPTKAPLLTLLKQGRAFGVGTWLATQNPVDLDYKALGNAGVKVIGRLITERDRERALEGLGVTTLDDGRDVDDLVAGLGKREFMVYNVRAKKRVTIMSTRWALSYLRGPVTIAEMQPLLQAAGPAAAPAATEEAAAATSGRSDPPLLSVPTLVRFSAIGTGLAEPRFLVANQVTVERRTLNLLREHEELWLVPVTATGKPDWEAGELLEEEPDLIEEPPEEMRFPPALPAGLNQSLGKAESGFVTWRARQPVQVLANCKLKLAAAVDESREAFIERCRQAADEADDSQQARVRNRYEKRVDTLRDRLERERDELVRDQAQLQSRKAEEKLGVVEGLFSVLLGSRSLRSAAGKAATKVRSAAGKRRMRQRAEASVVESVHEIERLEEEIEDLAIEMQEEIDRIAATSDELAEQVEEQSIRPKRADVVVHQLELVWL